MTGGPLAHQPFEVRFKLPGHAVLGAAFAVSPAARVRLDYLWTGWESFDQVPVTFDAGGPDTRLVLDYQNTSGVRVGAEYAPIASIQLRAGYARSTAAQPTLSVSPLFPEGDRSHYSAGFGWALRDRMRLDVGYQFVHQGDRRGRVAPRSDTTTEEELERMNVGVYASRGHVLGATFSYQFGPARFVPGTEPPPTAP
jgi:long-chain fatty acid transport protein